MGPCQRRPPPSPPHPPCGGRDCRWGEVWGGDPAQRWVHPSLPVWGIGTEGVGWMVYEGVFVCVCACFGGGGGPLGGLFFLFI